MARPSEQRLETGRALGILIAASGLSSFAALPFQTGTNVGRSIALLIVAAAWLSAFALGRLPRSDASFVRAPLLAAAVFSGIVVLSSAVSPYRDQALTWGGVGYFGAPLWLALAIVFTGAARVRLSRRDRMWLALALAWVPVSALWTLLDVAAGRLPSGGFNTSNPLAAMLVLAVPVGLWGASVATSRAERVAWLASAAVAVAAVLAAGSAAGWLALAVEAGGVVLLAPGLLGIAPGSRAARVARAAYAAIAAPLAGLVTVWFAAPDAGVLPHARVQVFGDTYLTRLEMWRMAAGVVRDHPLLGAGADSFQLAAQPHLTARLLELELTTGINTVPPDPHSIPLLVAASFGVLGLVAFAVLAALWVRSALVARDGEPDETTLARRAAFLGVTAWGIAGLFIPWAVIMGGAPALVAGLAIAAPAGATPVEPGARTGAAAGVWGGLAHVAGRVVAGAAAAALLGMAGMQLVGLVRIDGALAAPDPVTARVRFESAAKAQPTYAYPRFMAAELTGRYLGGDSTALAEWRSRVDSDAALWRNAAYLALLARDGLDQAYRFRRTDLSWELGLLERAERISPDHPDVVLERAHVAVISGDLTRAADALDATALFAPVEPRHALYAYYLAVASGEPTSVVSGMRDELAPVYEQELLLEPGLGRTR